MTPKHLQDIKCWCCVKRPAVLFLKRQQNRLNEVIPYCKECEERKLLLYPEIYSSIDFVEAAELFVVQGVLCE